MEDYLKKTELINKILLFGILIIWTVFYVINLTIIRKYNEALIENARLEQQVIDYRWQLEQTTYILGE